MSELVARTGRLQQRYENGYRLIAGYCSFSRSVKELGFLFDRGNVDFGFGILFIGLSSKVNLSDILLAIIWCIPFRYRNVEEDGDGNSEKIVEVLMINSTSGPGLLFPKHFLGCYPFKSKTLQDEYSPEGLCRAAIHAWMRDALEKGFSNWFADVLAFALED
ncbi:UNVERIFIED_CONTAM: Nudix hydrolase 16, mitochondrial [Sesamum calycinum]|uniref:Nudix hydrolase 16, mitochondrial n=1 Tax=Sesamum calycinum TaxID=2727403 RepID=A0AAW2IXF4_9LAMI